MHIPFLSHIYTELQKRSFKPAPGQSGHHPRFKHSSLICIPAVLGMTLLLAGTSRELYLRQSSVQFRLATQQLFQEEMTASTLNMHYTIAHPEDYGIQTYEATLPYYQKENRQKSIASLQEEIAFYKSLDASKLSNRDAHSLRLLITYLESTLDTAQYPYYEEPLSPSSGMQSQLPILLAEYTFRCKRDVEDYLAILSQTGTYFDALLTFETEKKEAGLLSAASSLRNTAKQCRSILTQKALDREDHFLQLTFSDRLQELFDTDQIDAKEMETYIQQNNRILSEIMLPAYSRVAQGLEALADPQIILEGLAAKPDGAAYYEALLKSETGSHHTIREITQLLTEQLEAEYNRLNTLLKTIDPSCLTEAAYDHCNELFPLKNCADMLIDLRNRMEGLFPHFPQNASVTPSIHVKEVAPCLQDYCAPAFYLTPPLDDSIHNSIYINTKTTLSAIDLYTTLAHEGFPGHMYQTVYSNQLTVSQESTPIRQILWFGGYLEGWALYVEFMAYDYAAQIMAEQGEPEYEMLLQIEKHNRSTQLCLYALLDLFIHHENIGLQGTAELLARFGITNSASVSAIYEYIVEEPANYPKYYLGYLEILLLKESCRQAWGDAYSDYTFHKFFLENGPADFGTLNDLVTPPSSDPDIHDPIVKSSAS